MLSTAQTPHPPALIPTMKLLPQAYHRRNYRCVQRPIAVCVVPDVVEDQKVPVVSSVNNGADLNGQVDGGRAANHGNVYVV